jgi:hypothetical protein
MLGACCFRLSQLLPPEDHLNISEDERHLDRISNAHGNQIFYRAEQGDKRINLVASFVLGIHFTKFHILVIRGAHLASLV